MRRAILDCLSGRSYFLAISSFCSQRDYIIRIITDFRKKALFYVKETIINEQWDDEPYRHDDVVDLDAPKDATFPLSSDAFKISLMIALSTVNKSNFD